MAFNNYNQMSHRGMSLPAIRGSGTPVRSYDITEQEFDALNVQAPHKRTIQEYQRAPMPRPSVSPRLDSLENKLTVALSQQNKVLSQQQQMSDALHQQQEVTRNLIEKAFQNRDDFIENLRGVNDNRLQENTRLLLGQHLRYITAIVQRLNADINSIEDDLRLRDHAVMGTNQAVGKLEIHHVTVLQDLRNRIARCDASLMKHSADIRQCFSEVGSVSRDQIALKDHLSEKIHRLESEMLTITAELERLTGQQISELGHLRKDHRRELELLDEKSASIVAEIRNAVSSQKDLIESSQRSSESRMLVLLHKATDEWTNVMNRMEKSLGEHVINFNDRLNRLEDAVSADRKVLNDIQLNIEGVVMRKMEAYTRMQLEELSRAKQEFREGFTSVHDSIANAKTLLEGKLRIVEDKLRKEISQVRKIAMLTASESDAEIVLSEPRGKQ